MAKVRYEHAHLKLTAVNLLATAKQESVLHPYPRVRTLAGEAISMLEQVREQLRGDDLKKNSALNMLTRLYQPDIDPGAAHALSMLRQGITSGRLDTQSFVVDVDTARRRYLSGLASASLSKNDDEIARWQWLRQSLTRLTDDVNFKTLWDLSALGVQYADRQGS